MAASRGRTIGSFGQAFTPLMVSGATPPEAPSFLKFLYTATRRLFGIG